MFQNIAYALPALLRGITSKHDGQICLNCPHSFRTEKNLNHIKKYVKVKIFLILCCLLKTLKY